MDLDIPEWEVKIAEEAGRKFRGKPIEELNQWVAEEYKKHELQEQLKQQQKEE